MLVDAHLAGRQLPRRRVFLALDCRRVDRHFHFPVAVVAHRIQRQIRGDAEQPGGELRAGRILLARAVNAQKHFLRQIFRRRRVAHHAVEEIDQGRAILPQQKSKDASSPAFTSSISWTSDLAMASTVYLTHSRLIKLRLRVRCHGKDNAEHDTCI